MSIYHETTTLLSYVDDDTMANVINITLINYTNEKMKERYGKAVLPEKTPVLQINLLHDLIFDTDHLFPCDVPPYEHIPIDIGNSIQIWFQTKDEHSRKKRDNQKSQLTANGVFLYREDIPKYRNTSHGYNIIDNKTDLHNLLGQYVLSFEEFVEKFFDALVARYKRIKKFKQEEAQKEELLKKKEKRNSIPKVTRHVKTYKTLSCSDEESGKTIINITIDKENLEDTSGIIFDITKLDDVIFENPSQTYNLKNDIKLNLISKHSITDTPSHIDSIDSVNIHQQDLLSGGTIYLGISEDGNNGYPYRFDVFLENHDLNIEEFGDILFNKLVEIYKINKSHLSLKDNNEEDELSLLYNELPENESSLYVARKDNRYMAYSYSDPEIPVLEFILKDGNKIKFTHYTSMLEKFLQQTNDPRIKPSSVSKYSCIYEIKRNEHIPRGPVSDAVAHNICLSILRQFKNYYERHYPKPVKLYTATKKGKRYIAHTYANTGKPTIEFGVLGGWIIEFLHYPPEIQQYMREFVKRDIRFKPGKDNAYQFEIVKEYRKTETDLHNLCKELLNRLVAHYERVTTQN